MTHSWIFPFPMHDRQNVDICCRGQPIDNQIRQACHCEFSRIGNVTRTAEQRELTEHHHRLTNMRDYTVGGPFIIYRYPVINGTQIIACLRRKINVQGRVRATLCRQESFRRAFWIALGRFQPLRASMKHSHVRLRHHDRRFSPIQGVP
jgi:hypothetical protein